MGQPALPTLTHGDLRSDNLFRSKTPGLSLTFIDWQTLKVGPIGVELAQMMSASMTNPEDYETQVGDGFHELKRGVVSGHSHSHRVLVVVHCAL